MSEAVRLKLVGGGLDGEILLAHPDGPIVQEMLEGNIEINGHPYKLLTHEGNAILDSEGRYILESVQ
jgi:hypothetical protein